MTTSKSKPTPTEILAEERQAALDAEGSRRDLLLVERNTFAETVESVLASWAAGDDTHSQEVLGAAQRELQRTDLLLSAAERQVKRAKSRLINLDNSLAKLLVPAVESAYAVDIQVATTLPEEAPSKLPVLVIVQLEHTSHRLDTGNINGTVSLHYYRTEAHAPLDKDRLTKHLKNAHISAQVGSEYGGITSTDIAGGKLDTVTLKVHRAFPELPVISGPGQPDQLQSFAKYIARELEGQYVTYSNTGKAAYPIKVSAYGIKVISRTVEAGNTTLIVSFDVDYGNTSWVKTEMPQRIITTLETFQGVPQSGLGRLASSRITGNKTLMGTYGPSGTATTVEATFISKQPK
jgi:hypothetical protein